MMAFFLIALGYLVGSIPFAYVIVRRAKGIDLRRYGSGNVGASNVMQFLGLRGFMLIALLDIAKGASVVLVAQALNRPELEKALTGLATIAGHNWPIYLRFHGGRGVAAIAGVISVLVPQASLIVVPLTLALLGLSRDGAISTGVGLLLLPLVALALYGPGVLFLGCLGLSLMAFAKRLQGSPGPAAGMETPRPRRLFYRLLYDRDVRDRDAWVTRRPDDQASSKGPAEE